MLRIRHSQMRTFEQAAMSGFETRMVEHLRTNSFILRSCSPLAVVSIVILSLGVRKGASTNGDNTGINERSSTDYLA
jgi:hypothetical protein